MVLTIVHFTGKKLTVMFNEYMFVVEHYHPYIHLTSTYYNS